MATRYAVANGNWSSTATWDGGTLPANGDDVYANNYTVTIDQTVTANTLRNATLASPAITAGGYFSVATSQTVTITGNVASAHIGAANGLIRVSSTATLTLTADLVAGGTASYYAVATSNSASINLTGTVTAGTGGNLAYGIYHNSTGTVTVSGAVTGGGSNGHGVINATTGSVVINDSVTGGTGTNGYGASNSSTGTITINGNVTGGSVSSSHGVHNASTGTVTITGTLKGGSVAGAAGVNNASTGSVYVSGTIDYKNGTGSPYNGPKLRPTTPDGITILTTTAANADYTVWPKINQASLADFAKVTGAQIQAALDADNDPVSVTVDGSGGNGSFTLSDLAEVTAAQLAAAIKE